MNGNQYYSIVSDRISELRQELDVLKEKFLCEEDVHLKEVLNLQIDMLSDKISKLSDITLLPLYVSISGLSSAEIFEMETKSNISFAQLQDKLHLDKVRNVMTSHKIVTLSYLKEIFVNDVEAMNSLIKLQSVNFMCANKLIELSNYGVNSISQLNISLRQLDKLDETVNPILASLESDYSLSTLKEVKYYMNNKDIKLSREFVLKHQDKVLSNNPEMAKVLKKINKSEKFGFINKLFKNKRNKNEERFVNAVMDAYKNDNRLSVVNLKSSDGLLDNSHNMKKFIKSLGKKISIKRNEMDTLRSEVTLNKNKTMSEIKYYQDLRESKKCEFISILKEKSSFLPKMFAEQLWNEPNLKESLFKVAYLQEEKALMDTINSWSSPVCQVSDIVKEDVNYSAYKADVSVRRLTA